MRRIQVLRSSWAAIVGAAAFALPSIVARGAEPADAQLAERLARLRATAALEREFVETKQLALLAEPLESRGLMAFTPPDSMRWQVLAPEPSLLLVEGERVLLSRPGAATRQLDLAAEPGARGLVDAIRMLLAGDVDGLRRRYELTLAEAAAGWRLALAPRAAAQRRVVTRIELAGSGDAPAELWLDFANGDRSHVVFEPSR